MSLKVILCTKFRLSVLADRLRKICINLPNSITLVIAKFVLS